jgi:cytochrome c-type biogenesis protein CcmH/NrfG
MSGEYEKAETAFRNAAEIDPENADQVVPFYRNIALQNPGDDTAYVNLGFANLIVGDYLKAQDAFKDALGIDPENAEAKKGLKILSQHMG